MQRGLIFKRGPSWFLRHNVRELRDGIVVWKQRTKKLAPVSDQFRTPGSVRILAEQVLAPLNTGHSNAGATQTVSNFIEFVYLPDAKQNLKPSTLGYYNQLFRKLKPLLADIQLREFRTSDADGIIRDLAKTHQAATTRRNIKGFLSGVFREAVRKDLLQTNPIRECKIPKGAEPETHAYSLEEIFTMVDVLPEPARTVLVVMAFTGLGPAEIRGPHWDDYTDDALIVRRNVWKSHVGEPKTRARRAPVPVISIVKKALETHRKTQVSPGPYIFAGGRGKPLHLENLARRDVIPPLKARGLIWHGWYACRRGLATNLNNLQVSPKVIQQILRHSNETTAQRHYIQPPASEGRAAMKKLERSLSRVPKRVPKHAQMSPNKTN